MRVNPYRRDHRPQEDPPEPPPQSYQAKRQALAWVLHGQLVKRNCPLSIGECLTVVDLLGVLRQEVEGEDNRGD